MEFSLYNGLAGDQHELLILIDSEGRKVSMLFDVWAPFYNYRLKRTKKKLMKKYLGL